MKARIILPVIVLSLAGNQLLKNNQTTQIYLPDVLQVSDRLRNFVVNITDLTRLVSITLPTGLSSAFIFLASVCSGTGVGTTGMLGTHLVLF